MTRKIIFPSVLLLFLFFSCEQKSKKGAWIKSEKGKCVSELRETIRKDKNFDMIKMFLKSFDEKEFSSCVCDKLEKQYDSFAEADKKLNKNLDQEASFDLLKDCMGSEFKDLMETMENLKNLDNLEDLNNLEDLDNSDNTEQF